MTSKRNDVIQWARKGFYTVTLQMTFYLLNTCAHLSSFHLRKWLSAGIIVVPETLDFGNRSKTFGLLCLVLTLARNQIVHGFLFIRRHQFDEMFYGQRCEKYGSVGRNNDNKNIFYSIFFSGKNGFYEHFLCPHHKLWFSHHFRSPVPACISAL